MRGPDATIEALSRMELWELACRLDPQSDRQVFVGMSDTVLRATILAGIRKMTGLW